jgi:hypothetical protein
LPRDPFFLVSSDGGQSWRTRPVSEDGGPGSIQRFWFDSPEHGELVIDAGASSPGGRYLSYESQTGGESWMIRGTFSEAPRIRRAPPSNDNPDFRIRPIGGKVYRIEKRTGDSKWDSLASFLIEVASCAIKPPEVKEPPATEAEQPAPKDYAEELKVGAPDGTQPGKKKGPRN